MLTPEQKMINLTLANEALHEDNERLRRTIGLLYEAGTLNISPAAFEALVTTPWETT